MTDEHWLAKAFLEQCPAVLWAVDRNGAFHKFYGDPSSVFGRTAAELKDQAPAAALDPDSGEQWKSRFARALAGETLMLRERHGDTTWYVTLFPIRREGEISHAGGVARDSAPWSTADQELRHTVLGALKSQEFERKMASQFLHDSVGQNLTALGLQLDLIRMDLETVSPETCARVDDLQKTLETIMEEVREYSYELNPSTVERAGLRPALDRLATRLRQRFAGGLRVKVDNGRGFDPGDILGVRRGLGLLSMEHYAAQAGLQLTITSNRETGTLVRAASAGAA